MQKCSKVWSYNKRAKQTQAQPLLSFKFLVLSKNKSSNS